MPTRRFAAAALLCAAASLGQAPPASVFHDPSAPIDRRIDDVLAKMTLDEKVSQLQNDSPAIDRLGIPAYNWWNECLHGVARAGRATVFPQTIGLAATWDPDLIRRVATVISDEARAKHHEFVRHGKRNIYQGLTFWTPNINLFRDPRWGRGMETWGEDPVLTGTLAVEFIKGIQGDDPKYFKAIATAKHYAIHSGPESLRHTFDARVSEDDLRHTYLPQFEMAIKAGGAQSVMCAYNRVDGLPACANPKLLDEILRKDWGFKGYIVSDCAAIRDIYQEHKTSPNANAGVAAAIKAGTDLNCGTEYAAVGNAVRAGLLAEKEVDASLRRLLEARLRLGMFDPPAMVPYAKIPYSVVDSKPHRDLALETARKSIVLLKNEGNALPLRKSIKTVAVIGPDADDAEVLLGNYNGEPTAPVTPLAGIRAKLGASRVIYARGSGLAPNLPLFEAVPSSALWTANDAGKQHGLKAEYFATGNFDGRRHRPRELTHPSSGQLVGDVPAEPKPLFTRTDPQVDFQWWDGSPRQDLPDDDFGVRWTGYLAPPVSGKYYLGAYGMSAFELYLDGKRIAGLNNVHENNHAYADVQLEAGKTYPIRLEFHHFVQDALIRLEWSLPETDGTQQALDAARKADATIMVLGLSPRLEGEEMRVQVEGFAGGDRVSLNIPRVQEDLLRKVVDLKKPVVLVLLNGSSIAVNYAKDHVPAIVEAWYPGQAGGTAIADVLFGDYNPAGRLPVTFYKSADQLPPFTDYNMKGRTYRYFDGEPLWAFGHGLSYTTFSYKGLNAQPDRIQVEVANTGKVAGEEVVQVYTKSSAPGAPIRSLAGFRRVALRPGERRTVEVPLHLDGAGPFQISVGGLTAALPAPSSPRR